MRKDKIVQYIFFGVICKIRNAIFGLFLKFPREAFSSFYPCFMIGLSHNWRFPPPLSALRILQITPSPPHLVQQQWSPIFFLWHFVSAALNFYLCFLELLERFSVLLSLQGATRTCGWCCTWSETVAQWRRIVKCHGRVWWKSDGTSALLPRQDDADEMMK